MRKVWYHQIWIHNNFVFIVLILDSTCILIWCIYSTLCMFRKSGCSRYIGSRAYSYRYHCVTECMLYLGKYISLPQHLHVNLLQTDKRINADILIFRRKPPKPQNMPNVWNATHFHMEKSAVTITSYYWGTGWLETEFLVPVKILQNRSD